MRALDYKGPRFYYIRNVRGFQGHVSFIVTQEMSGVIAFDRWMVIGNCFWDLIITCTVFFPFYTPVGVSDVPSNSYHIAKSQSGIIMYDT